MRRFSRGFGGATEDRQSLGKILPPERGSEEHGRGFVGGMGDELDIERCGERRSRHGRALSFLEEEISESINAR